MFVFEHLELLVDMYTFVSGLRLNIRLNIKLNI